MKIIGDGNADQLDDLVALDQVAQQDPDRQRELRRWLESGSVRVATKDGPRSAIRWLSLQRLLARRGWVSAGMVFGLDEGDPELFYQFTQSALNGR
ncbi:hypothetical protein LN996_14170 [Arthrobacter sp. AK01]|uniref:hypothetical protein n=1 Tax=Micrococcaceae TaxID=1268 RepID=UPI001E56B83E|nr:MULTISPECIES: hypothetical protein [Micrococcaceae]MCD4851962.1 hypothetical protein [Arthrobacter sp. AK01]MCP1412613.1 hypothetical protein [Paenarthrobacter sp. A20]